MSDVIDRLNAALEGRYRIEDELGEGGMATVYLADDLKHNRKVAIKVLRPELAAVVGGERFLAEIETTANLQHPHILPLFDSGEADSFLFYVMPYVEGESLRHLLDRERQLPMEQALAITTKVAGALQHAHDRGVVHRDVKPANILVQDGEPLVADFGIALALSQAGGGRITETGLSLGTPHYMSPEQATGERDPDQRSDVYSLGCLAYEMLTGEPPHHGGTAQAVLTRLLTARASPPSEIRHSIPPHVDAAILKALERLPADRFQEAKEFSRALSDTTFTMPSMAAATGARTTAGRSGGGALAAGATGIPKVHTLGLGAVLLIMLGTLGWALTRTPEPPPTTRAVFAMPAGQEPLDALYSGVSFTPDASALVYVGPGPNGPQLWVKERNRERARALPGTNGAQAPETDPTGQWVAYISQQQLRKAPMVGGPSVVLVDDSVLTDVGSAAWLDDDNIAFVGADFDIQIVPQDGGASRRILERPEGSALTLNLTGLPGGNFLFVVCENLCRGSAELRVWDSKGEESRTLEPGVMAAWYVESGHLILVRGDGTVFGAEFDARALELRSEPVPLFEGVQVDNGLMPDMDVSPSGHVLAQIGSQQGELRSFHWVDRRGVRTPVDPDFRWSSQAFPGWRISPDGRLVAFAQTTDGGDDIWVKELDEGPVYRLTFDEAAEFRPTWYADSEHIMFVSERGINRDLYRRRANATGPVELVLERDKEISQGLWSADGRWLVYREGTSEGRDLWVFNPDEGSEPRPLIAVAGYDEKAPAISPDSRWIAYESDESGADEIYVRPFPAVEEGKWQISVGGGMQPVWAHSGRELFYVRGDDMLMAASIDPGPPFRVGPREALFSVADILVAGQDHRAYDIHPDDQRFLLAIPIQTEESGDVYWLRIDHWTTELNEALGGGR